MRSPNTAFQSVTGQLAGDQRRGAFVAVLAGWAEVLDEAPGFAEGLQSAGEGELSGLEGDGQRREERPAEVA